MKEALAIVAHIDDETIWMGGMILKHKDWKWTIYSLCRKNDIDRAPRFVKVCKYYGADHVVTNLEDEKLFPLRVDDVVDLIKRNLPKKEYDYIFTHGYNGEYGHVRHREVHRAINKMLRNGELKCKKLFNADCKRTRK